MTVRLVPGDCLATMRTMALVGETVHAIVCDPPYHLTSTVKRFGGENAAPAKHGTDGAYARASAGFMGKVWDGGDIAFRPETWRLAYDLLPPGGHLIAFGGTRTFHRMAVAIEDAGFELRDTLMYLYGVGFPKSHDVSKGIDKALGVKGGFGEPKSAAHAGWIDRGRMRGEAGNAGWQAPWMGDPEAVDRNARRYLPGSPEAAAWTGWGTALKPAWEPIVLARKPLTGTVADTVLAHGTGALNIDGCRVATDETITATRNVALGSSSGGVYGAANTPGVYEQKAGGRWPANVLHDGSDEVEAAFAAFGERTSGSASRFFYSAKTSRTDRNEGCEHLDKRPLNWSSGDANPGSFQAEGTDKAARNNHPTVKPTALMRWLVRLVCPPGGTVLDPFMGSGSTGKAAVLEGMDFIGCEMDPDYMRIAAARIRHVGGDVPEAPRVPVAADLL